MRLLKLVIFILVSSYLKAQILDTTDAHHYKPFEVYKLSTHGLLWLEEDSSRIDTQMHDFYNSYSIYKQAFPFLDLGFEGSPSLILKDPILPGIGLNMGMNAMGYYLYDNELNRYHTQRPYTHLNYSQGSKELIYIEVQHVQQISERLTFGLDYRRLKNQNFYYGNLQNADFQRFANIFNTKFYTGYYNKKRSYEMVAGFIYNKSENLETGGIQSDSLFEALSGRNKLGNIAVSQGHTTNNYASHTYKLQQYFRLNGGELDTNHLSDMMRFGSQIVHEISYHTLRNQYVDDLPDSAYYGKTITELDDSVHQSSLRNELGWMVHKGPLKLYGAVRHEYDKLYQDSAHYSEYQALIIKASGKIGLTENLGVGAKFSTAISGYNEGAYDIEAEGRYTAEHQQANVVFNSRRMMPYYLQTTFYSDVMNWVQSMNMIDLQKVALRYSFENGPLKLMAGFDLSAIKGLVYVDSAIVPKQDNSLITYHSQELSAQYTFGPFVLGLGGMHQYSSDQEVLPRPEWSGHGDLYVKLKFFKKKLHTQLGVKSWWYSDVNAPTYIPFTRMWMNTGSNFQYYSPINVYVNTKVKSFYLGLNVFHAQQGFMGESYYSSPHYPLMPRAFRLNIRWDLGN